MNLKRGWRLHSPTEKRKAEADRSFSHLSQIADFSPECSVVHTFPISSEKAHKSAHRLQQVGLLWMVTLEDGNLESYGCNSILALIILIVTGCLKEAKTFSLFNAVQILCISIMEKPCCRIHRPYRPYRPHRHSILVRSNALFFV